MITKKEYPRLKNEEIDWFNRFEKLTGLKAVGVKDVDIALIRFESARRSNLNKLARWYAEITAQL